MKTTRREVLQLFSWAMALPTVFGLDSILMAGVPAAADISPQELAALDFFNKLGYTRRPAMNLITGDDFNDGLRYDETPQEYPPGRIVLIQDCVRMEDLPRKEEPQVLPYFHIFSLSIEKPVFRGELLTQLLEYLVIRAKLAPTRMALVSTESFKPYLPHLEPFGIKTEQFVQRDRNEAMTTGDGSGYFNPPGHPYVTGQHSVSIHYAVDAGGKERTLKYPLPGYLEIAEVVIDSELKEPLSREMGGLGLERLAMAKGEAIDSFPVSKQKALTAIKAEAERRGVALPKAHRKISNNE